MNDEKSGILKISVFITSVFIIFLSITYALINQTVFGNKRQILTSSTLLIELEEGKELTITDAMPMYDEVGKIQENSFHFRLINNGNYKVDYTLHLADITKEGREKLSYENVKYYLTKDTEDLKLELLSERTEDIIDQGVIDANQTIYYILRLWIDSKVENSDDIYGKTLSFQLIAKVTEHIPEEYTITYHTGTDLIIENGIKIEGKDYQVISTAPTKENHRFLGWSTTENGTVEYASGSLYTNNQNIDLYAIYGINYLYNNGNQYASDTGGWKYTRDWNGTSTQKASDTATFASKYLEWSETNTRDSNYQYYGGGHFQNATLLNLTNATKINFKYTVPNAVAFEHNGVTYYPRVWFYVKDSNDKTIAYAYIEPSKANTSYVTTSINVVGKDLSSVRIQVLCSTTQVPENTMTFRLYSVYATY